jgi:hypothetical protein
MVKFLTYFLWNFCCYGFSLSVFFPCSIYFLLFGGTGVLNSGPHLSHASALLTLVRLQVWATTSCLFFEIGFHKLFFVCLIWPQTVIYLSPPSKFPGSWFFVCFCFCFFVVLGIEPRAFYMLGKYSTTWAIAPDFFGVCFWNRVSLTCLGWHCTHNPLTSVSEVAGIIGLHHYAWHCFFGTGQVLPK